MKVLLFVCAVVAMALASPEAPRYQAPPPAASAPSTDYGAPLNEYGPPSNEYGAPAQSREAPYPPSGWKPSGRQFSLPLRQTYYAPPPEEYGPPPPAPVTDAPTTEAATEPEPTTTETPEDEDASAEGAGDARAVANAAAGGRGDAPAGVYYVLLPDGRLQRVAYSTDPAVAPPAAARVRNAGYTALQYMDVEPVRAPIYSYGAPFVRVL